MQRNHLGKKSDESPKVSDTDRNFLMAVRGRDYVGMTKLLKDGANIDAKFGESAEHRHDACSFCGPNDTPLMHAAKKEDQQLVKFLLDNKASTEVFNLDETPLMNVAFHHNAPIVELLLKKGANANTRNTSNLTAMHFLFLGLRSWLLDAKQASCIRIVNLLIEANISIKPHEVANVLEARGYSYAIGLFAKTWLGVPKNAISERLYTEGVVRRALGTGDVSRQIASCLDRKDGGRLALTSKKACTSAPSVQTTTIARPGIS